MICILAQQSHWALPAVGRLWPSDLDDDDVVGDDGLENKDQEGIMEGKYCLTITMGCDLNHDHEDGAAEGSMLSTSYVHISPK